MRITIILWLFFALVSRAGAEEQAASSERFWFNIPQARVEVAIKKLSRQTGYSVIFQSADVGDIKTNTLAGRYTLNQALETLFQGTGLSADLTQREVITLSLDANNIVQEREELKSQSFLATVVGFLVGSGGAQNSLAQSQDEGPGRARPVIEEVIVTSRKRAESLDDVPISVSVTSGEKLDGMAILNLEELSGFTPNLQVNEDATQQYVSIRGIGSGANQAFEQSVGLYIDGVYFGRGPSARAPFFDVGRVEVLKGPQGILFGKNTIAGAINITTRKPSDELEAELTGEYFSEIDRWATSAIVSGPLSDTVRGRIAANYKSEDGFMENTFAGRDEPAMDQSLVRGILEWDASDSLSVMLKGEVTSTDIDGRAIQLVVPGPLENIYKSFDPSFETDLDYTKSTTGKEFHYSDTSNLTMELSYDVSDSLALVSTTAYVEYDFDENVPAEMAPIPDYTQVSHEQDHEQFSQEFRFHYTPDHQKYEFLGGVYYQSEELNIAESYDFNLVTLINLGVPLPPLQSSTITFFDQDTESYAAFGEGTYNVTDRLRMTLGLRYSRDEKDLDKQLVVAELGTTTPAPSQYPLAALVGRVPHQYSLDRTDEDVSPSLGVQYDVADNGMVYATWSQGYKSGGFDAQNNSGALDLAQFEPEEAEAWEVGGKFTVLDGAAKFSVAYFNNEYTDLQVSGFDGVSFIVQNAASSTSKGVEADFQWRMTDNFTLGGAVAWLDAEYDSFPNAVCTASQQIAFAAETGNPPGNCIQDLSGEGLRLAPEINGNLNAEYVMSVMDNYRLTLQGDINFTSSHYLALDRDPATRQEGYEKYNARLELASNDGRWSVAIIGKNLTDEKTAVRINDLPLFRGAYFGMISPPRSVGIQARISF